MTTYHRFFAVLLFAGSLTIPVSHADPVYSNSGMSAYTPATQFGGSSPNQSYGRKTGNKALNALANLGGSVFEVPKNIINTTNDSNIFYGITGGLAKGLINTVGRMSVGITDLVTAPIPTKPIAYPVYAWENTKRDTTYGNIFELDLSEKAETPVAEAPVPTPSPVVVAPRLPVVDDSGQYNQQTNRKIDTLFKRQMMK